MADTKISALTAVATPADTDVYPLVQGGANFKATRAQLIQPTVNTVAVTDASYTAAQFEIIILDDDGDNTDIDVTFDAALAAGKAVLIFAADGGSTGHSVTLGGSQTWEGTNNTADFDTAGDYLFAMAISATRMVVLSNNGVTFS